MERRTENLSSHINKGKREGDCQFEVVKCCYWSNTSHQGICNVEELSILLIMKRMNVLPDLITANTVGIKALYKTFYHHNFCDSVPCPNECDPKKTMPHEDAEAHKKNDCPFEPVLCELCWAGCTARPQHKDIEQHIQATKYNTLHYWLKHVEN